MGHLGDARQARPFHHRGLPGDPEDVISRQKDELLELSTPVVELWDDVLAVPLVGTLDSARTQIVMETLLEKIVSTGASIAIIDITGCRRWTRWWRSTCSRRWRRRA